MSWSIQRIGHALTGAELRRSPRLDFTIVRSGNDLRGAVFARVAPTAALVAEIDHTLYEFEILEGGGQTVLTAAAILREFEALEGAGQLILMGAGAIAENEAAQGNGYLITNGAGDILEAEQLEAVGQLVHIGPGIIVEAEAIEGAGQTLVNGEGAITEAESAHGPGQLVVLGAGEVQEHEEAEGVGEVVEGSGGGGGYPDSLYLEAHEYDSAPNGVSPWTVEEDVTAEGGQNIIYASGSTVSTPSDGASGVLVYNFSIAAGTMAFFARGKVANNTDDSFHWKIDSGSWNTFNKTSGFQPYDTWVWQDITESSVITIAAGAHTLSILPREDGFRLDRFYLAIDGSTP